MSMVGPSSVRHCTVCGALASPDSTFCNKCGRVLEVPHAGAVAYCHECGGETALGDLYCPKCGAPQPPNTRPSARPPEPPPQVFQVQRVEIVRSGEPNILIRGMWFIFVGLWLGMVVSTFAWLAIVSVLGLPLGLWLVNRVPAVMTLRSPTKYLNASVRADGTLVVREERPAQYSFTTRAIYFVAVGWWLSFVWLVLAWVLAIMIIPIPLAMWMYEQVPTITTLERY